MYIVFLYERNSINKFEKLNLASISIRFPLGNISYSADLILDLFLTI